METAGISPPFLFLAVAFRRPLRYIANFLAAIGLGLPPFTIG
jgi:hypothetical protein